MATWPPENLECRCFKCYPNKFNWRLLQEIKTERGTYILVCNNCQTKQLELKL